jgi:hypothetical protein
MGCRLRAPARYITGTTSVPVSADSERMPASPNPKILAHTQATQ